MQAVTDEVSNPFGMRAPCSDTCAGSDRRAVFGFGDANADFHAIGDHPGVHGGATTGVPFTGFDRVERFVEVLSSVGLLERSPDADHGYPIDADNCFLSYLHMCCPPAEGDPSPAAYADLERFFDAELRAISAHVLLPVGDRAVRHVIEEYTARAHRLDLDATALHAREIRGRGFLVVPVADPREWDDDSADRLTERLRGILARDYQQTVDLGRFDPTSEPYLVR